MEAEPAQAVETRSKVAQCLQLHVTRQNHQGFASSFGRIPLSMENLTVAQLAKNIWT